MKKTLFLLVFIMAFNNIKAQTIKDSLLEKDINLVVEEIRFIYNLDQGLRKYLDYGTFDKRVTDSIENLTNEEIINAENILKLSQDTKDKIWTYLLSPLDSIVANRMIKIIDIYGFPSIKRLEKYSREKIDFEPYVIFLHTPFNFREKMIPIIEKEFNQGNLKNQCQYGYLLWHLNGRSDFSYMLENGYKMNKNSDGTFKLIHTCK